MDYVEYWKSDGICYGVDGRVLVAGNVVYGRCICGGVYGRLVVVGNVVYGRTICDGVDGTLVVVEMWSMG